MKRQVYILVFGLSLIIVGCATTSDDTFYWGNYSTTLYDYKKNPGEETLEAHKKELISVMEYSSDNNKKVPPGLNAEYGYILLKEGKSDEGIKYLDQEIELYPESKIFMTKIKDAYSKREK